MDKPEIVAETLKPGASVNVIAQRYGMLGWPRSTGNEFIGLCTMLSQTGKKTR